MIVKPELVKKIKNYFNLNIYETRVWLALLTRGVSSVGEISEVSGVPRSRTYDVLESLEKQGFAITKLGKPVKYLAVKPGVVVEKMKNNAMKEASEKVKVLGKLKGTTEYKELEQLHQSGIIPIKHEDLSSSIKGHSNIYNYLKEIMENSKREVIICNSAKEILKKQKVFAQMLDRLRKNKVAVKVALSGSDVEITEASNVLKVKPARTNIDAKFFISDREQILFAVNQGQHEDHEVGIWINSEFFANSMASMFDLAVNLIKK